MSSHRHDPFSCRLMTEHSSAFLDGTLGDAEWARFRTHLELCPPCAEYIRQMGMTVELLRKLPGERGASAREMLLRRFQGWSAERGPGTPKA